MTYLENLFSLSGKNAIVTGAARGNGRAIAQALMQAGARVLLVDKLEQELRESSSEYINKGLLCHTYVCDLSQADQIKELISFALQEMSTIDILVNNAGISLPKTELGYSYENWRQTLSINLDAAFLLSTEAAELMKDRGGCIINITSLNAELAFPDNPAYMASKGALKQLGKSLALDYAEYNIRVNNVGPGYIHTSMTDKSWNDPQLKEERSQKIPLGRWGEPEDLCGTVVFLASSASAYITGQDIYVDGGWLIKGL